MALFKSSGAADVHRSLLELNDHVRALLGTDSDIKLPTIAVIGNQSAGKSSVLERLCGVQLPRGAGTVTKVPAVLSMRHADTMSVHISEGDGVLRPISEAEVPEEMLRATESILKAEQLANGLATPPAFSCTPINLRIEGPEQQNLTVVDLPGIVYFIRRPGEGGARSSEIDGSTEAAIKEMYMKYIADPNCVILCTLPATEEPGTQKAYLWAREVDPEGRRTLGVITKTDRADNSMGNLADRMKGEGVNGWDFALGVVALRNSTQEEAAAGQTAKETDEKESLFFHGHKDLKRLDARYKGLASLERRLVELSKQKIAEATPGVLKQVSAKIHAVQARLHGLPLALADNVSRHMEMHRRLQAFTDGFKTLYERRTLAPNAPSAAAVKPAEMADFPVLAALACQLAGAGDAAASAATPTAGAGTAAGVAGTAAAVDSTRFMRLMARLTDLCDIFEERVRGSLADLFGAEYRAAIELELEEAKGGGLPDSVPEYVTQKLVEADAAGFKPAADDLVSDARQYMGFVLQRLAHEHFAAYPLLEQQAQVAVGRFLDGAEARLSKRVEELIAIEADIFTLNHYYGDTVRALLAKLPAVVRITGQQPSESLVKEVLAGAYDDPLAEGTPAVSEPGSADDNSNIEHSVLQVQVRLYAYRKVMLKRFLDEVCGFMRLMLPRAFATGGQATVLRQLLGGGERRGSAEDGAEADTGTGLTLDKLMAAAPEDELQRSHLQDSLQRLKTALSLLERMQASLQTSGMTASGAGGTGGAGAAAAASR